VSPLPVVVEIAGIVVPVVETAWMSVEGAAVAPGESGVEKHKFGRAIPSLKLLACESSAAVENTQETNGLTWKQQ